MNDKEMVLIENDDMYCCFSISTKGREDSIGLGVSYKEEYSIYKDNNLDVAYSHYLSTLNLN
tara:strand:+ start:2152 stop:2337 length:186 start_codon:yes stop_codon:yes gene_type:complete